MSAVLTAVECRPLFEHERNVGEFDVVSIVDTHCAIVHNCLMHPVRKYLMHRNMRCATPITCNVQTTQIVRSFISV